MQDPPPTKATILISGNGSNLQALIDASSTILPYLKIVRVVSNKKDAYGLVRAQKAAIPTAYHNLYAGKYLKSGEKDPEVVKQAREKYDQALAELVLKDEPDIIICAGWMHILAPTFLDPLVSKDIPIINLHPALPQMYDGAGAIERAYADFKAKKLENDTTGIMIHYVINEVDRGQPIVVRQIKIKENETEEELKERVHENEHELIVEGSAMAISQLWENRRKSSS